VINPAASLVYSSYITSPGYQYVAAVDYDAAGNIYVTGLAGGDIFPPGYANKATGTANWDAFLLVFSPSETSNGAGRIRDRAPEHSLRPTSGVVEPPR
jgi:hypothetical protein